MNNAAFESMDAEILCCMIREILAIDIDLPTPFDSVDHQGRGSLKGMLFMTSRIPALCQDEGECRKVIQDGIIGMLASAQQQWFEKLDALVASNFHLPHWRSSDRHS